MTARKKNDLRSLIEEAHGHLTMFHAHSMLNKRVEHLEKAYQCISQALSLLPDADESASNWQEFDPEREETWPKEVGWHLTTVQSQSGIFVTESHWDRPSRWGTFVCVIAYQPLPPPYHPKEDVEIKP